MNEKDEKLIKKAETLFCTDWAMVESLQLQAESKEAKEILHSIENRLYHTEEYLADCQ